MDELLRSFVESDSCTDSPLSRVDAILSVARDDDDRAILRLLTTGAKNDVIAARIFASEQTVKNRLSRMMKVVGVSNRTEFALLLTGTKMPPPPAILVVGRQTSVPTRVIAARHVAGGAER